MKDEKKCRGMGKALGHGCGKLVKVEMFGKANRKFGLGLSCKCYTKWLTTSDEGKALIERTSLKSQGSHEKKVEGNWNQEKKVREVDLMSKDKYRATYIQPLMNHIARIIDNQQPCIATGNHEGKMAGGHRHSVGGNGNISLNLHNIHIQSFHSNDKKGGDHVRYRSGIIKIYGRSYANFIDEELMQCPQKLWDKQDLIELKPRLQKMVNYYKKINKVYNALERLKLRNRLNEEIGLYPEEYSFFKNN